jgi:hypothetical protein
MTTTLAVVFLVTLTLFGAFWTSIGGFADLGISCARHFGAELVGLGVIDEPTIVNGEPVPLGGAAFKHHRDETLLADARRRVEEFLEHFGDRCRESGVAWRVLEDVGLPHEQISLEAQSHDVILLGQQTYFHFETHRRRCETLEPVSKSTPRPVITVPRSLIAGRHGDRIQRKPPGLASAPAFPGPRPPEVPIGSYRRYRGEQDGGKAIGATSARLLGRSLGSRRDARRRGTCRIHRGGAPSLRGCAPRRAHGDGRLRATRDEGILARIGGETVLRDSPVPLFLYH